MYILNDKCTHIYTEHSHKCYICQDTLTIILTLQVWKLRDLRSLWSFVSQQIQVTWHPSCCMFTILNKLSDNHGLVLHFSLLWIRIQLVVFLHQENTMRKVRTKVFESFLINKYDLQHRSASINVKTQWGII